MGWRSALGKAAGPRGWGGKPAAGGGSPSLGLGARVGQRSAVATRAEEAKEASESRPRLAQSRRGLLSRMLCLVWAKLLWLHSTNLFLGQIPE